MPNTPEPVLLATGISKFFPGAIALDDVSLSLYPGEVHALLGENGAGKSTLIKCLTGAYKKDSGTILLENVEVSPKNPQDSLSHGIGTVYQEVNLLPNLTVAENLFLGWQPTKHGLIDQREMVRRSQDILTEFGLDVDPTQLLSSYSIAIQQVIAIARAVELAGKVLILDEPTASLDRDEIEMLFTVVRRLTARGMAVVFITHFLDQVFEISDRATVLRNGRVVGTRILSEVTQTEIITLMLGRHLAAVKEERIKNKPGDVLLSLRNYGRRGTLEPFDLDLREGEVVGLAGLLGSGRTETTKLIFGAIVADRGTAELRGKGIKLDNPRTAIGNKFGLCPEDRKIEGVVGDLSVRENIILSLQARRGWTRPISKARAEEIAQDYVKKLDIRLASLDMPIRLLSGGNQQKALLARWLATDPDLLILDEPTRGIDVGAHAEIIQLIQELRQGGMAMIVASSEMEELITYSDRIIVLRDRRQVRELQGDAISINSIISSIAEEEAAQ
ncbi:sugar ABC transporter ATP-binding protein [Cohaesibacter celericrescens]|uniref:Sugar ABC transporter ATP-binding protein n=1 Tax=Cohaesibacter celericrescens TaxID=2067669 RepID=A0A2N5XU15_9HYPH|nr:sugar ABC transporter ATP-binding protein [Cohaesibacter celericrescens]PLW77994.1 sugar ABC transporter ATP-binding protein [Cohaesibacter celericrescens]